MPRLACWSCGRQLYTTAPIDSLFADERRCPRCGAYLQPERRDEERRDRNRRVNPDDDPGPPDGVERRMTTRRKGQRRRGESHSTRMGNEAGWYD